MSEVKNFHCMVQASSGESFKPPEEDLVSDTSSEISKEMDIDEERDLSIRMNEPPKKTKSGF